ncbi:MAG TPA: YdcF family protein [Alphaproteobacteria bacterium]|nr:YdcF family protein [Alphaproteobacteria bacterium]
MFLFSKLFQLVFSPGNFILLLMVTGAALIWFPEGRARRWGRWIVTFTALGCAALASSSLADMLMQPLENRFPIPASLPAHIDGIIVLGGAIDPDTSVARGQITLTSDGMRLTKALEIAHNHPEARVVFTGGSGQIGGDTLEAPIAREFLIKMGLDPKRITIESQSRNTYENAIDTKALIHPKPGQVWVLITSAFHMPRAVGVFRKAGWDVIPYPVAYHSIPGPLELSLPQFIDNAGDIDYAAKEWAGMLAYWLLGRTNVIFPAPQPLPAAAPAAISPPTPPRTPAAPQAAAH